MQPRRWADLRQPRAMAAACAIALAAAAPSLRAQQPQASAPGARQATTDTLARLRTQGRIRIGYRTDARPFSYTNESGQPDGYSIDVCKQVVDAAKRETGAGDLTVQWVVVTAEDRFRAVAEDKIDLLCGADTVTLSRREHVSFSIPIFPGGLGAVVRADAPARLRDVLAGRGPAFRPVWRASATQVLQTRSFSAVQGTTSERWLTERVRELQVIADVTSVRGYSEGIQALLDKRSDVLFGERAVLLDAAARHPAARDLTVIDRLFTYEPIALALARGDEGFRLFVDRTLSGLYSSGDLAPLYTKWFGEPDGSALAFFKLNTLPQ